MRRLLLGYMFLAIACEPELGGPCDLDGDKVLTRVIVKEGTNDLVKDVAFDLCESALCGTTDGSRPYCTRQCESDTECGEARGFTCQQIVHFGALACSDFVECPSDGSFPCDCLIDEGAFSQRPIRYCAATAATIIKRDVEFGRPPFVPRR